MAAPAGEHVYATLLLSDSYLPGALVLAHSLRDAGTAKKLAVLVTLDSVSAESITQLKTVYDYVFPVPRIRNDRPANLHLMDRADLHSAFTKINLWKLTQFSKIVYIDADVVAYRAPDELFALPHSFAAAPDIGWPDLFNTGVMVLSPNMGDFYAMMAMAERGISFDGADQGLINMHFGNNYHRLSFTYNVTPSAHYQYVPAYRHFQSSINMVHFIGTNKPWFSGREASYGNSPFDEMVGRWWAVYDRHYRVKETQQQQQQPPEIRSQTEYVQYFTKGEFHPQETTAQPSTGEHRQQDLVYHHDPGHAVGGAQQHHHHHEYQEHHHQAPHHQVPHYQASHYQAPHHHAPHHQEQHYQEHPHQEYQHQEHHHHEPHPEYHQPEHHPYHAPASGHEQPGHQHHEEHHDHGAQARDSATRFSHFVPSSASISHDSGSKAEARVEQQVPEHHGGGAPPPEHKPRPAPIPSWDAQRQPPPPDSQPEAMNFPSTHYEMSQDTQPFVPPERYPSPPRNMWYEVPKEPPAPSVHQPRPIFPWEGHQPRPSRAFRSDMLEAISAVESDNELPGERMAAIESRPPTEPSALGSITTETTIEPSSPTTPTQVVPVDPWTSFPRNNAWDDVPEINRYVEGLQKHRRVGSQGSLRGALRGRGAGTFGFGLGGIGSRGFRLTDFPSEVERPSLPVTPAPIHRPTFWGDEDPERGDDDGSHPRLPAAEGVPAQEEWDPAAQLQMLAKQQSEALLRKLAGREEEFSEQGREIPSRPLPYGSEPVRLSPPTYVARTASGVLSPQPVKGEATTIPEPSYSGPGAAWERGEDAPQQQTPLPPSEEEKDILQT